MSSIVSQVAALRAIDLQVVAIDHLKTHLGDLLLPVLISRPHLTFTTLWRARLTRPGEKFKNIRELWYPPAEKIKVLGRANNIARQVFYCSSHPYTAVIETKGSYTALYTLLACAKREDARAPIVMPLGFGAPHPVSGEQRASTAPAPKLIDPKAADMEADAVLVETFLREEFTRVIPEESNHLYKITVAISELLMDSTVVGGLSTDGLAYAPVTAEWGSNIALRASSADELLSPLACWQVFTAFDPRVNKTRVLYLARSTSFSSTGEIEWQEPAEPQPFFSG
jgi:hypothetical protein